MGALIGQTLPTAAWSAGQSMKWGALSTGLEMGAEALQGIGGYQQARYAASLAREGAANTRAAGQYEESAIKGKTTRLVAEQKVAQAANGIDVNSGSAVAVRDATQDVGDLDAAMVHFNAMREAFGLDAQAALYKKAGTNSLIKGALGATSSFLSGASSLSDKWQAYKQSGAL